MIQPGSAFADYLATRSAATLTIAPGVATPRRFSDARTEHLTTRRSAGLSDFSFMGCVEVAGTASLAFLRWLQTRALESMQPGRIAYTLLLRDDGTVLNDATVWRLSEDRYWLFTGRRSDCECIAHRAKDFDLAVTDLSGIHAVISLQGAAGWRIIERCFNRSTPAALPYFGFRRLSFAGSDCWLARIGYSGETGYELVIADRAAPGLWRALLSAGADAGLAECGFDAIDSLRIEAGHVLFARELAAPVDPFELGLTRLVDFHGAAFRGAPALQVKRWRRAQRSVAGLLPAAASAAELNLPPRIAPGRGVMTSACWSPLYERCLGIGFVNAEDAHPGTTVVLHGGVRARVARLPFYDPARRLPRKNA